MFGLFNLVSQLETARIIARLPREDQKNDSLENKLGKAGGQILVLGML